MCLHLFEFWACMPPRPALALEADPERPIEAADLREARDEFAGEFERQRVRDALERLGGRCRTLLEALFGASGEPSYPLISEQLGIRVGSIGPTRARCLEKLATILSGGSAASPGETDGSDG